LKTRSGRGGCSDRPEVSKRALRQPFDTSGRSFDKLRMSGRSPFDTSGRTDSCSCIEAQANARIELWSIARRRTAFGLRSRGPRVRIPQRRCRPRQHGRIERDRHGCSEGSDPTGGASGGLAGARSKTKTIHSTANSPSPRGTARYPCDGQFRFVASDRAGCRKIARIAFRGVHPMGTGSSHTESAPA
jgi:hypothetical protein